MNESGVKAVGDSVIPLQQLWRDVREGMTECGVHDVGEGVPERGVQLLDA